MQALLSTSPGQQAKYEKIFVCLLARVWGRWELIVALRCQPVSGEWKAPHEHPVLLSVPLGCLDTGAHWKAMFHPGAGTAPIPQAPHGVVLGAWLREVAGAWWERAGGALDDGADKKLFEVKRKDQMNALKNLIELNDINQQYKIIDIMLKGLFKVRHSTLCARCAVGLGGPGGSVGSKRRARWDLGPGGRMLWGFQVGQLGQHPWGTGKGRQNGAVTEGSGRC